MQLLQNCIGPTILIGQEIQCLPYAGFKKKFKSRKNYMTSLFVFQVEEWIERVDFDGDGQISYEEFKYSISGKV